jgi:uracil-DNA glycosylase
MLNKKDLLNGVKSTWLPILDTPQLDQIISELNKCTEKILPTNNRIFNAFKFFDMTETKIIMVSQDPYPSEINAMGIAFSVPKGTPIPGSLKNIYKELELNDQSHGDLTNWVKNNQLLLLNSALSVIEGKSNSQQELWREYTENIIKYISNNVPKIIFVLLGSHAQSKVKFIDTSKHVIINGVHPSPLSAHRGFLGSGIFDKLDDEYEKIFKKQIEWQI